MNHTTSLDELLAALSAGVTALGLLAFAMAFVDADPADFDPRPAARRILAAAHQGAVHAGHDLNFAFASAERLARHTARDMTVTAAALLMLLSATPESAR